MNKKSDSSSGISIDSLEIDKKKKSPSKGNKSVENVDTILVPFYEKDVLMKVPKGNRNQPTKVRKGNQKNDKSNRQAHQSRNYLVNKDPVKNKKSSYLERFRKQFSSNFSAAQNTRDTNEIRSISPEFGDTERESIENETINNPEGEFYNTESYNEIYYEKLMNRELKQYIDDFMEDELHLNVDIIAKTPECTNANNFKSVSEVSQTQRPVRRVSVPPAQNVRLGGLGPDMENIKPRLQRARSLQRYSEKVRMENRLRIYKKTIEAENEKKAEREASAKKRDISQNRNKEQKENKTTSYLLNKTAPEKPTMMKKIYSSKSKSADLQRMREREKIMKQKKIYKNENNIVREDSKQNSTTERKRFPSARVAGNEGNSSRVKSSSRAKATNREEKQDVTEINPVHISFLVNVGGVRPSSALKILEAQHRVYQEKVKAFTESNNE